MTIFKFGAEWCAACKALEPTLEELEISNPSHEFISIDVDTEDGGDFAMVQKIKSLPTVVIFNHREEELFRFTGSKSKGYIQDIIDELS
jgi:thioredoxin 1